MAPVAGRVVPPVGPGATYTGTTPPIPGLFGGIGSWFSGQDMAGQGAYVPADYRSARAALLGNIGASLLAAGQPMSGAQRAQILQGLGGVAGQYNNDLRAGQQARRQDEQYAQQKAFDEYSSNPENLKSLGFNDNQITLLSKMPQADRIKTIEDALGAQFKTTGAVKADLVTLVSPDGKAQRSFNISDPAQVAQIQQLTQNGWTERQGSSANVNVNVGDKLTEGQARTIMLWPQMNQANQVLDTLDVQLTDPAGKFAQLGGDWTRWTQTPEYQQADQAATAFTTNYLYATSGATATEQEVQRTKQMFFPQVGDNAAVIAQKKQVRMMALQSMKASLGNQAGAVDKFQQQGAPADPNKVPIYNPKTGEFE
jgi:hypothetical protein